MKLPRVSAVVAAAVLAPAVLFPTAASASDAPKPTGISGPDTGSDSAKDTAPEQGDAQEQRDRAEVERILAESPAESWSRVHEGAEKALKGGAADLRHFLAVELDGLRKSDNRLLTARIHSVGGPAVKAAARAALNGGDDAIAEFLKTGQYTARAEDEDRARVEAILADPKTGPGVREGAEKALKGGAADLRQFLTAELPKLRGDDNRVKLSQLMAAGGRAVREAAGRALDAGTDEAVEAFLNEGFAKAQFEDDRVDILRVIADKESSSYTVEAAQKAMGGNAEAARHFMTVELPRLRADDNRVKLSRLMDAGGPAVRAAAGKALDAGTNEAVEAFLKEGWAKARAEDEAAAAKPGNGTGTGSGTGTGTGTDASGQQPQAVQPAGLTETTTGTGTGTATRTGTTGTGTGTGTLAATGADGLGWEAGGAAAALAAGAALVVAARRRSTGSTES
ncbi:ALF repeat-containing protein [Kitasatospora sp. NPDC001132]